MKKQIVVLIIFYSISSVFSWAWGYDGEVHSFLNKEATDSSQILDLFLKDNFGYPLGTNTVLKKGSKEKTIKDWIAYGGEAEDFGWLGKHDFPRTRAFNHFHDPLKEWDAAAFDNPQSLIYTANYFRDPVSAILWGLKHVEQDFLMNLTGDWSWGMAREYYYIYLTGKDFWGDVIASIQDEREANFADSFRSLGQVMHLLQDMSVPLHTRNDLHVFPIAGVGRWTYETYTKKNKNALNYSAHPPDPVLLSDPQPDAAYVDIVPISGLFDRNQYNGGSIPADNNIIGLAEYSNANFLTEDTMWTYPHPNLSDTNYADIDWLNAEAVVAEDGNTDNRIYIRKTQGEQIDHFAAIDYFTLEYYDHVDVIYSPFLLDEECWKEYASKLIPRAVGYSAGLLDYFFRGTIEITDFEMQINTPPGHYQTKVGFNKVTLHAKNISPESENMEQGTVHLVVKYKVDENERFLQTPPHPSMEFQYITKQFEDDNNADPLIHSIPRDDPKQFEFDLSGNPVPLNATEIYFYLVYRGTLGLENDGIGVGYAPFIESRIIDVGLSDEGVYALTAQDPTTQGFDSIALAAKSVDPENRNMSGGTIQLVVKYMVAQEDQFQNPPPLPIFNFNYIVKELPGLQAIPDITSDPIKFEFDLSDSQIPLWATDIYLYLVYKGQIGLQEEAVAVGFKDISEPTLISYYNSMDKICISGVMYDAGDEAYAIAVAEGQENEWDVFPHDRENVYMRYSSFENPQSLSSSFDTYNYNIPYQAAGEYLKLFILTDYQFAENSSDGEIVVTDPRDDFDHYIGNHIGAVFGLNAIKNQIEVVGPESPYYDPNQFVYLRGIPEFSQFRDIENSWWVFSLINRPLPEGSPANENCSFE